MSEIKPRAIKATVFRPLNNNKVLIYDLVDHENLSSVGFYACRFDSSDKYYVLTTKNTCTKTNKRVTPKRIHRMILNPTDGLVVDHINGNPLDNRRANLRVCTQQQNSMNQRVQSRPKSSIYKGVHFDKSRGLWVARVKLSGKYKFLGRFSDENKAAVAYNDCAKLSFGEFANLNVIKI